VKFIVDSHMQVIGVTDGSEIYPPEHPIARAALMKSLERRREAHRQVIPGGAPVMNCPNDGTVAMLADKLGASHDEGWTAECPLCGLKIPVGRFACVTTLAYFKRKAHYDAENKAQSTD
jgi:hypothetical protein